MVWNEIEALFIYSCRIHNRPTHVIVHLTNISLTYFCGWDGSSPRETVSPGMSLKHFWQKLYLSENKAGVGFLQQIVVLDRT